jgi:hypothetical protein
VTPAIAADDPRWSFSTELSKRFTDRLTGFLGFSCTFVGNPAGEDLKDRPGWTIGAEFRFAQALSLTGTVTRGFGDGALTGASRPASASAFDPGLG